MWFSERALVFADTRSAAIAVYARGLSGPRLRRFASERFGSPAPDAPMLKDVVARSATALTRLARDLRISGLPSTLVLPLGAAFPSIVELAGLRKAQAAEVDELDAVRFRIAPLLPYPVAQAEVRTEASPSIGPGVVLAQAIPKEQVLSSEKVMRSLGFGVVEVASALSAAFRGLPARAGTVDLIFGDSACAIAVRGARGGVDAVHLRLLLEGDDRAQRALDEAQRTTRDSTIIRVLGEDAALLKARAPHALIQSAFDSSALPDGADPQMFPFLAVFARPAS